LNVGNNLKRLRLSKKLTQKELGKKVNTSQAMIAQLERGTKALNINLAYEITKVLKCKLDDLVK